MVPPRKIDTWISPVCYRSRHGSVAKAFAGFLMTTLIVGVHTPVCWSQSDLNALVAYLRATRFEEPGENQTIGLIDQDFDLCNPGFFEADAGVWAWNDVNGNNVLDPGVDDIDIGFGSETLSWLDVAVHVPDGFVGTDVVNLIQMSFDRKFQPAIDWLFLDRNRNGVRDCGAAAGFSDSDPALGEPVFVLDDLNGDGVGSLNEHLFQLGTSRVRSLRRGSYEFFRGRNLAVAAAHDAERTFHGTAMANLVGIGPDVPKRHVGAAWMADLVLVAADNEFEAYTGALWAEKQGIGVLLIGLTRWALEPLDGSSPLELLVDQLSDSDVVVVAPTGNLGRGNRHAIVEVGNGDLICVPIVENAAVTERYLTVTWLDSLFNPSFLIRFSDADGDFVVPPNGSAITIEEAGMTITGLLATTEKSTHIFTIVAASVERFQDKAEKFSVCIHGSGSTQTSVTHWVIADNAGAGANAGSMFPPEWWNGDTTLTSPATADTVVAVGAIGGRFVHPDGSIPGQLRPFSGRGPRIDGKPQVTVVAPDDRLVSTSGPSPFGELRSGDWVIFGGTSAASAHVAGGIILLRQLLPTIAAIHLKSLLVETADLAELLFADESSVGGGVVDFFNAGTAGHTPSSFDVELLLRPEISNGNTGVAVVDAKSGLPGVDWKIWWDDYYDGTWDVKATNSNWHTWPTFPGGSLEGRLKVMVENPDGYRVATSIILSDTSWDAATVTDVLGDTSDVGDILSANHDDATQSRSKVSGCQAGSNPVGTGSRSCWGVLLWVVVMLVVRVLDRKKTAIFAGD